MTATQSLTRLACKLAQHGFTSEEIIALRRISMTLHRWAEQSCGNSNAHCSWSIERDEESGLPYSVVHPANGKSIRMRIPDREAGALKRLRAILADKAGWSYYHQTDPRGVSLYLLPPGCIPAGSSADSCYNNGIAIQA